uniref:Alpha-galactosidase n=1 Tax=Romanomermis culicivorax TaxID=13658 RepID=A0A915IPI1_ROMCU
MSRFLGFFIFTWTFFVVRSLDNGLVLKPPMGWLSWTKFLCQTDCQRHPMSCISENLYTDMADWMVSDGYLEAGYEYVNIDDCWSEMKRDKNKELVANKNRFPHGIKWLADYMHAKGLKLGIYEDFGNYTCAGYPGSLYFLEEDAKTFASWGVDMLKLDGCYASPSIMPTGYPKMSKYLNSTGRPIVYSCSWPAYEVDAGIVPKYPAIAKACNLWRNYGDISLKWDSIQDIINWYDKHQDEMIPVHGPGQWNDPDMIIAGNPEITVDQSKAQMAIWSIWSAPLLMSNDLRFVPLAHKKILLNKKVIAVDQDPLGVMGRLMFNTSNVGIYIKKMTPFDSAIDQYSYAIVFFNRNKNTQAKVSLNWSKLGLSNPKGYLIEDLFADGPESTPHLAKIEDNFNYTINATGVVMVKATVVLK